MKEDEIYMKLIMQIKVSLGEQFFVDGLECAVNMISFTGEAYGKYFNGKVIGTGVDTQKIVKDKGVNLSARYMLEGTDYENNKCRVFIENNGSDMNNCTPLLVTDSKVLKNLQKAKLRSSVEPIEGGVLVSIFKI